MPRKSSRRPSGDEEYSSQRSKEDFLLALNAQRSYLARSCEAFDAGHLEEAARMAAAVFIVCHDGSSNTSLLTSLGLSKRAFHLPDTTTSSDDNEPGVVTSGPPLLALQIREDGSTLYVAPKDAYLHRIKWVKYSKWWEGEIYRNIKGFTLSRKNLVMALRNWEGGAHFDRQIGSRAYANFTYLGDHAAGGDLSPIRPISSKLTGAINSNLHSMRQIAWELEVALNAAAIQ